MELQRFDCEQGTPEWLECRLGCITASEMHTVMAKGKSGGQSITRRKYMLKLASEIISGIPYSEFEGNFHTERGKIMEPIARDLYQERTGKVVHEVGFFKRGIIGASPDGLLDNKNGVEIKSKLGNLHLEALLRDEVPSEHMKQIQTCIYVMDAEHWDFFSYSPGLPIFIKTVNRDDGLIGDILFETSLFHEELQEIVQTIQRMY